MTTRYEKVTFRPEGGKAQTVLLAVTSDSDQFLCGEEVGEDGDTRWTVNGTTSRTHVIEKSLVIRRVRLAMNNHYGLLEDAQ